MAATVSDPPSALPAPGPGPALGPDGLRILLLVQTAELRVSLSTVLSYHGCAVVESDLPRGPLTPAQYLTVDLAIAEHVPGEAPPFRLIQEWRRHTTLPLMVIGAAEDELVEAACRYSGADEYLRRPITASSLIDRVAYLGRRRTGTPEPDGWPQLVIDVRQRWVQVGNARVRLTRRELQVLDALTQNAGSVVPRQMLLDRIWGIDAVELEVRTVDATVARVRRRLRQAGYPDCIETVSRIGYRMRRCRVVRLNDPALERALPPSLAEEEGGGARPA